MKVLLTDLFSRKTFDVFNILKRKYINDAGTVLASSSGNILSRIKYTLIYLRRVQILRKGSYRHFEKDLLGILQEREGEMLAFLPMDEDTILLFYEFVSRNSFPNLCYLLPPRESFNIVKSKKMLSEFCRANGIPVPREYRKEDLTNEKFVKLVVKPNVGSGAVGIKYIEKKSDLGLLDKLNLDDYIVQEKILSSDNVVGSFYLFHEGEMVSYYGHRRIRTYPSRGGVTTFSKVEMNNDVMETGRKLLEMLRWSGFAMVEFLYDEISKKYKVIEVNPRIWGSFMLSEFCGANFLINYLNILLGRPLSKVEINKSSHIRWLFPFDFLNYIQKRGKISDFWKLNVENTCYINFTYAGPYRSLAFIIFSLISVQKIRRLFEKLKLLRPQLVCQ